MYFRQIKILLMVIMAFFSLSQPIGVAEEVYRKSSIELLKARFENPKLADSTPYYDVESKPHLLKEAKGKLVILYFWASWCSICKEEIKSLNKLADELSFKDLNEIVIIAVSIDFKNQQRITEFMGANQITKLDIFSDPKKELMNAFDVKSLPTTFIINKQGFVINGFEKALNWQEKEVLPTLLAMKDEQVADQINPYINSDSVEKGVIINQKNNNTIILK